MKNKRTLYILIPLVATIWGVVIWKVIDYQPSGQDTNHLFLPIAEETTDEITRYELSFGYRDPFLRSSVRSASVSSSKKRERANNIIKVEITKVAAVTRPADLIYHGEISGHRHKVGLLEIEGNKVLVSESSMVGEYTILSVETDSLIISYRDKRFTYGKQ